MHGQGIVEAMVVSRWCLGEEGGEAFPSKRAQIACDVNSAIDVWTQTVSLHCHYTDTACCTSSMHAPTPRKHIAIP